MEVKKYDRFDLEQSILDCWKVVDDLKMLVKAAEHTDLYRKEELIEIIKSIITLYELKFNVTFTVVFENFVSQHFDKD
jgi:phage-related holin